MTSEQIMEIAEPYFAFKDAKEPAIRGERNLVEFACDVALRFAREALNAAEEAAREVK